MWMSITPMLIRWNINGVVTFFSLLVTMHVPYARTHSPVIIDKLIIIGTIMILSLFWYSVVILHQLFRVSDFASEIRSELLIYPLLSKHVRQKNKNFLFIAQHTAIKMLLRPQVNVQSPSSPAASRNFKPAAVVNQLDGAQTACLRHDLVIKLPYGLAVEPWIGYPQRGQVHLFGWLPYYAMQKIWHLTNSLPNFGHAVVFQ